MARKRKADCELEPAKDVSEERSGVTTRNKAKTQNEKKEDTVKESGPVRKRTSKDHVAVVEHKPSSPSSHLEREDNAEQADPIAGSSTAGGFETTRMIQTTVNAPKTCGSNTGRKRKAELEVEKGVPEERSGAATRKRTRVQNEKKEDEKESIPPRKRQTKKPEPVVELSSSSSESEWEDVAEHPDLIAGPSMASETPKTIQITVNAPKTQKELDLEGEIRRAIKRFRKECQENLHKAHLLAFIAHGRFLSSSCNDATNKAIALSLVPIGYTNFGKDPKTGKDQLARFVKWFCSGFTLTGGVSTDSDSTALDTVLDIRRSLQDRKAAISLKNLALCFVTTVRALGFDCRIVMNAHPISRKTESEQETVGNSGVKKANGEKTSPRDKVTGEAEANKNNSKSPSSSRRTKTKTGAAADETCTKTEVKSKFFSQKQVPQRSSVSGSSKSALVDTSSEAVNSDTNDTCDYWAEVYLESIEQWLAVNLVEGLVDDLGSIRRILKLPLVYCLGFDRDLAMKDVTGRYSTEFMSTRTRRLRVQEDWLTKTFKFFRSTKRLRTRLEDMQLDAKLSKQALPTSLGEYKNHPLYVLKKDLKKFEGIYPPDTKSIGFIRNEPIYPRSAVHMLHGKDQWRKEALVIKENEKPYKIVKGRPRWDAANREKVDDREVPLYGLWQTEPYKPKAAKDGIVPRNEYGNVELFKMSMLPPGTVYIEKPGLLHVAKKLDIDCAPAMVGWEFHGRGSHPVLNGWVVCEEYKDVLLAAWEEEQVAAEQRERERRSKKALQNWRRLMKAMLIRQKLQRKFRTNVSDTGMNMVGINTGTRAEQREDDGAEKETLFQTENAALETEASTSREDNSLMRNRLAWPQCRREFTGMHEEEL